MIEKTKDKKIQNIKQKDKNINKIKKIKNVKTIIYKTQSIPKVSKPMFLIF